jgi:hypothetical protein
MREFGRMSKPKSGMSTRLAFLIAASITVAPFSTSTVRYSCGTE